MSLPVYAIDYETFYSKDYSIRDLGNYAYTHHPSFDAYLLAVAGDDGSLWVGNPKDFDWAILDGAIVVAHNAGFEAAVTARLIELGIIGVEFSFAAFYDTADLAAYLGFPRSLAQAALGLLGLELDKGIRDKAKGLKWPDMTPDFQTDMVRYAGSDAKTELRLWLEHGHKWPLWERELSEMTRDMCATGLPVDCEAINTAINLLKTKLWECRNRIPWAEEESTPALSKKLMAVECHKHGIAPPKSMAKDSDEFEKWLQKHGDKLQFAKAMGQYRSINMLLKKMETMRDRTIPTESQYGVMPYALKYGGAHTMRDSGDAGFNPQNFSRLPIFFDANGIVEDDNVDLLIELFKKGAPLPEGYDVVNPRSMITAPPGKLLGVMDLTAIEPCCLAWFAEDEEFLTRIRNGEDPYEAWARITGRYEDPRPLKDTDFMLRQYMKVEVLGLGYGAGWEKLIDIAMQLFGIKLTEHEAKTIHTRFRRRRFIPNLWKDLEGDMRKSTGKDFFIELPSGRLQRYRDVKNYGNLSAVIPRQGRMMRLKFWGGSLAENVTQAGARDVFMDRCGALKNEGFQIITRVHDEAVIVLEEKNAEANLNVALQIMQTVPDWMPGLPLRAEGHLCKKYSKA